MVGEVVVHAVGRCWCKRARGGGGGGVIGDVCYGSLVRNTVVCSNCASVYMMQRKDI